MKTIKVLVVDDSPVNRKVLTGMLESSPFISVAGTAATGEEAIERVVRLRPDLITLDIEMPGMDGFTFLRWLMRSNPLPVIVISSRADERSVIRALEFGAVDFLTKPAGEGDALLELQRDLVEKIRCLAPTEMAKVSSSVALIEEALKARAAAPSVRQGRTLVDLVVIGASTGGPPALQAILTRLPADFPAAVAISQHMPPNFTRFFAERLAKLSKVKVKEAEEGDLLLPGHALVAPGGFHLVFGRASGGVRVALRQSKAEDKYVPSVDAMMKSAALNFGTRTLGVILTGMGNDGREGMTLIKRMGGQTLAESKETAVIYGMPKEAVEAGAVDREVPLGSMAEEIVRAVIKS